MLLQKQSTDVLTKHTGLAGCRGALSGSSILQCPKFKLKLQLDVLWCMT